MMRIALGALVGALVLAAPAGAGTVSIQGSAVRYLAAAGEFNELFIMLQGGRFTIQDGTTGFRDSLPVTAVAPCEHDATPQPSPGLIDATCPATGIERIEISVGDGNDQASVGSLTATDYPAEISGGEGADRLTGGPQADEVHGDAGNDTLNGGPGFDLLSGGEGDDDLDALDGAPDRIVCGPGVDRVAAEDIDAIAADCELVNGRPGTGGEVLILVPDLVPLARLAAKGLRSRVMCSRSCTVSSQLHLAPDRSARPGGESRAAAAVRVLGRGRARRSGRGAAAIVTRLLPGARRTLQALRRPPLQIELRIRERSRRAVVERAGVWLR